MDRQIVCFTIPALGIALARLADHSLRHRPVAVVPATSVRALVQEVSVEAEAEGVETGMAVDTARRRCPPLHLILPDPARLQAAHHRVCSVTARYAPIWEPVRPGHLFLDLTGTTRLFGLAADTAARIERELLRDCNLAGVAGVASNKLVAEVAATLVHPPQLCDVRAGSERDFLAPQPVTALPWLRQAEARAVLAALTDLNLLTLGDIADVPVSALEAALGPPATRLHRWAYGIDPSPVLFPLQQPSVTASQTLTPDEIDTPRLLGWLADLLERVCRTLRRQQQVCGRLVLTLRYSDHRDVTRARALSPSTAWEVDLLPPLTALFHRCFQCRVLVRTLTLRAEALGAQDRQLALFDEALPARGQRLTLALDRVRERFGERAIWRGRQSR